MSKLQNGNNDQSQKIEEKVNELFNLINEEKECIKEQRDLLEHERLTFEQIFKKVQQVHVSSPIQLSIGGTKFSTTLDTLLKYRNSFFGCLFSGYISLKPDKDGSFFIDRDGTHFHYILNYLRTGELVLPSNKPHLVKLLLMEAEFYQIESLVDLLGGKTVEEEQTFHLFSESNILSNERPSLVEKLNEWVGCESTQKWRLVYKGSRDGFQASKFHLNSDNKGASYTILKSGKNIFGGYNPSSWSSKGGYLNGKDSFLFSLVNPHNIQPIKLVNHEEQFGPYDHSDYLPIYGDGHDLRIFSDRNENSYSYFKSYTNSTNKGSSLFTGNKHFKVDELEVFVRM
eukprot:TRINITY_DN1854_c0_g1_i2.p2 TRINITY_DN1854_c0_g1~~TRINITY_DN1854_c0_g1_i2.p2  ORF type:complete len:342 (+),score=62.55 TRINITY_DN1854_c0_g1_i2:867-1892(+)